MHHTTGRDLGQQARAFKEVTCCAVVVQYVEEAHHLIDKAISEALVRERYWGLHSEVASCRERRDSVT